ncbi:MAG TPA: porin family protein [Flavobacteriaceae bacterium]|nr:PorT family protein [Flavobacteriaceae bacterium]HEX5742550.1 porin family protein [Flavobacteriaceae bacterium]
MKKNLLMIVAMLLSSSALLAQSWDFGLKGGLNLATIVGDETSDVDSRTSFYLGGFAEIKMSDKFAFQPEFLYSSQGAKGKDEGTDMTLKLDYLTIPLMAKYYVGQKFSLDFGPQLAFLLKADAETMGVTVDFKDFMKSFDFGVNLGLGYELDKFVINGRYNIGLSNIWDNEDDFGKNQNSVIQIGIGYKF